jgi:hypothetical protein
MAQTYEFYDERAKQSAEEADAAVLDNVRDRALRSEKAWRAMADQAQRISQERERSEAERAARREEAGTASS